MKPWLISPERLTHEQVYLLNQLFDRGLERLHLRLPGASEEDYIRVIESIALAYRSRIVIYDYPALIVRYGLGGLHLPERVWKTMDERPSLPKGVTVSASCHSIEEIESFPFQLDYCFLSPVFDSLSKAGYSGRFSPENVREALHRLDIPVVALGGVTPERLPSIHRAGFSAAAVLGYLWQDEGKELMHWQELCTPTILCVGGVDPSAGAGITADVRTAEAMGVRAYTIVTAITYQGSHSYRGEHWLSAGDIIRQIEALELDIDPVVAKIGLIRDEATLCTVASFLKERYPSIFIVWDPVLKATADTSSSKKEERFSLNDSTVALIDFVTPNMPEASYLLGEEPDEKAVLDFNKRTGMGFLLKGGHADSWAAVDLLAYKGRCETIKLLRDGKEKHGTGCAHSTAFASALALDADPFVAMNRAQLYVSRLRRSSSDWLGLHREMLSTPARRLSAEIDLQFITHQVEGLSVLDQVEAVCRMGVRWVQLRMKEASDEDMLRTAYAARSICRHYGTLFLINDRVGIARQVDADGVHLGKEDMAIADARRILGPNKVIGRTCNTLDDVLHAYDDGADYVGIGPYRYTETKKRLAPTLGLDGYKAIAAGLQASNVHIPSFAIGGIEDEDIPLIRACGIPGIAVSGSLIRKIKKNN